MTELRKVWVLHSGEYSDYGVHAVCFDEAVAIVCAAELGVEYSSRPLLTGASDALEIVAYTVSVSLSREGKIGKTADFSGVFTERRHHAEASVLGGTRDVVTGAIQEARGALIYVTAPDRQAAHKAAGEYAAELGTEIAAGVPIHAAVIAFNDRREAP